MRFSKTILMLALFIAPVWAQQARSGDTPATTEEIQKLFTTMHIREQTKNVMEVVVKQQRQMMEEALRKKVPDISQRDLDRVEAMIDENLKALDVNGMIDDMVPVYARHLSRVDIAAMNAFYQSPTGQKMLREQPQMAAEAMQAMQPRMQKMMANMMDQAEKLAKDAAAEKQSGSQKN